MGRGSKFTFALPVFSTNKYIDDLFQNLLSKAELQGKTVAFILHRISDFSCLKRDYSKKQIQQLFDQFNELVLDPNSNNAHLIIEPDNGHILVLKMGTRVELEEEIEKTKETLRSASFFLGGQELSLEFHIEKALHSKHGDSKEVLLKHLGVEQEALVRFHPEARKGDDA